MAKNLAWIILTLVFGGIFVLAAKAVIHNLDLETVIALCILAPCVGVVARIAYQQTVK